VQGSTAFGLPARRANLEEREPLKLPAGAEHAATGGPDRVPGLGAHRPLAWRAAVRVSVADPSIRAQGRLAVRSGEGSIA